jgi:hypothetical protein
MEICPNARRGVKVDAQRDAGDIGLIGKVYRNADTGQTRNMPETCPTRT